MIKISPQRIVVKRNRMLALMIHYILKTAFITCRLINGNLIHKRENLNLSKIKKILVIRTDGLGDVVMSTPAFRALREFFPYSNITLLTASWSKELVETIPGFDEIIYFDAPWIVKKSKRKWIRLFETIKALRRKYFDLAIDLRGDFRNNIVMYLCGIKCRMGFNITGCEFFLTHIVPCGENHHPVNLMFSLIRYLNPEESKKYTLSLWITEEDRRFANTLLTEHNLSDKHSVIVIHPGAKWSGRHWVPERYGQIADRLIKEYKAKVILAGGPADFGMTKQILSSMTQRPIMAGESSLRQFCALLEKSDLFIGADSGPMHMATAMGTRVIALFGPARPEAVGPYGDGHIIVTKQDNYSCSPCSQKVCKRPDYSCMEAITVEDAWKAVEIQMKRILAEKSLVTGRTVDSNLSEY